MKSRILFLCLFFAVMQPLQAQFNPLGEVVLLPQAENYLGTPIIITLPEKNLLMFRQKDKWGNVLTFRRFDQELNQLWFYKYAIPLSHLIKNFYYDKSKSFYILSQSLGKLTEVQLLKIDVEDGVQEVINTELPLNAEVNQVKVLGNFAFIIGYYKEQIIVFKLDLADGNTTVVPAMYDRKFELLSYYEDAFSNAIYFMMRNQKSCGLQLRAYSQLLGLMPYLEIPFANNYTFIEGITFPVDRNEKLIFSSFAERCGQRSQGIAVTRLSNVEQTPSTNYYRFTNYVKYFDHFKEKKAERYRKKVRKRRSKGKEYQLRNYTLLQESPKEINEEIIVIAEGYLLEYQSIGGGERIFDGYRTYHATIIGFDKTGKKLWDNSIKVENMNKRSLEEVLQVGNYGDSLVLAYLQDDKLYSKMIYRYSVEKNETKQELKDILQNPKIAIYDHQLEHWYDNVFLVWGVYYANPISSPIYYLQRLEYIPMPDTETVENN